MKEIVLTQGKVAVIDDDDFEKISAFKWWAMKAPRTYYAATSKWKNGRNEFMAMHRFILDARIGQEVDHIDGNGLNNQKENLRLCTHRQNSKNSKKSKRNTSGYKGVDFRKDKKRWRAMISIDGKLKYLGLFKSPEEAHEAYKKAAVKNHGEFARFE